MKQSGFLKTLLYGFSLLFVFTSCNSGSNSSQSAADKDSTMADTSTTMAAPTSTPSAALGNVLVIKHKVANYDKWKVAYDSDDSDRMANGLHNFVIGRGMDDPNMILVVLKMDDVNKAKAFSTSQELMNKMKKGGVMGKPEISFINVVMNDTTKIDTKARLMATDKVKDWDVWKKVFDSHKQARIDAGLIDRGVGYSTDDNHQISLVFAVTDKKKADDFSKSKDLKEKRDAAGAIGPQTFFYYNIVQMY